MLLPSFLFMVPSRLALILPPTLAALGGTGVRYHYPLLASSRRKAKLAREKKLGGSKPHSTAFKETADHDSWRETRTKVEFVFLREAQGRFSSIVSCGKKECGLVPTVTTPLRHAVRTKPNVRSAPAQPEPSVTCARSAIASQLLCNRQLFYGSRSIER